MQITGRLFVNEKRPHFVAVPDARQSLRRADRSRPQHTKLRIRLRHVWRVPEQITLPIALLFWTYHFTSLG